MLQLQGIGQTLLIAVAVVGVAALIIAYFRSSYGKETMELLRGDIADANVRYDGIKDDFDTYREKSERKVVDLQTSYIALETQISEKNQEIHVLRSVVTGKDQLDRIEKLLTELIEKKFQ